MLTNTRSFFKKSFGLLPSMLCVMGALLLLGLVPTIARADMIVVKSEKDPRPKVLRGVIEKIRNGNATLTLVDGSTVTLPEAEIITIVKDGDANGSPRKSSAAPDDGTEEAPAVVDVDAPVNADPGAQTPKEQSAESASTTETAATPTEATATPAAKISTPVAGVTLDTSDGSGEGVSGLWPLAKGARWEFDDGDKTKTIFEVVSVKTEDTRTVYAQRRSVQGGISVTTNIVVETRDGLTYYSLVDAGRSDPILKLVEPVKVNWKWNVQEGYTRVVTSVNSTVVDGLGVTHDNCVRIELHDRNDKPVSGATEYYLKDVGLVNEQFVKYEAPPAEQK